jgi:hypothetical protein
MSRTRSRIRLIARIDHGWGAVTAGRSNLHAHDHGLTRFGLALLTTLLVASGLAIGWTVGASVPGNGGQGPEALAPIGTPPVATPVDEPTHTPTARATSPTPTPLGSTADGVAGGGTAPAAVHLDPRFGMSGDLLSGSVETARSQIGMLADDGLGAVTFDVSWRDMEPSRGIYRGLDKLDAVVAAATARTLQAIVVVSETPGWANGGRGAWVPPSRPTDYARFVGMLADRYAGRVAGWEVWNEPYQARFWQPRPNAASYARLLHAASQAIRSADPSVTVIAGTVAFDQTAFVRALYGHGAKGSFDMLAVKPAATRTAPDDPEDGSQSLTVTLDAFHNVLRQEDDEDLPIWVADLGWGVVGAGAVSTEVRVDYLQRAVEVVRERPWVGLVTVRSVSTDHDPAFGLSTNGRRSDAWTAYAAAVRDTGE